MNDEKGVGMHKPVVRIEGWQYWETPSPFYCRTNVLTGQAFGHPSEIISEGEPITTSRIIGWLEGYVETQNTLYELGEWSGMGLSKDELVTSLAAEAQA